MAEIEITQLLPILLQLTGGGGLVGVFLFFGFKVAELITNFSSKRSDNDISRKQIELDSHRQLIKNYQDQFNEWQGREKIMSSRIDEMEHEQQELKKTLEKQEKECAMDRKKHTQEIEKLQSEVTYLTQKMIELGFESLLLNRDKILEKMSK